MLRKVVATLVLCLLIFTLWGQKKVSVVKKKVVNKAVTVASVKNISPARLFRLTQRREAAKSLVVLKNEGNLLPLARLDTLKILLVGLGSVDGQLLTGLFGRYTNADYISASGMEKPLAIHPGISKSGRYNLVLFVIGINDKAGNKDAARDNLVDDFSGEQLVPVIQERVSQILAELPSNIATIRLLMGAPQMVGPLSQPASSQALLVTGQSDQDHLDLAIQLLFGAIPSSGKLSFELHSFPKGSGITYPSIERLSYVLPEEVGLDSVRMAQKMDSLVHIGLTAKAFPGCQLLLAKNGKVFFQKSYGFHTYQADLPVRDDDRYDLASVTKILAPVPALMMLADQHKFMVTRKMSDYWTDWKGSNKEGILISDLLSHQARLRSGVVLWPATIDAAGHYKPGYYSSSPIPGFELRVAGGLYLVNSFPDTVYKAIKDSPLLRTKKYAYSDLGFVILPKVIEQLSSESYERFLHDRLYAKLGAFSLKFHPAATDPLAKLVPTELDQDFRHELLQGYVHDETAAMLGGVSGNAGLFGSMGDVAKVMQLYLQNGSYGKERFITEETLKTWTSSHTQKSANRRGYGFDKPGLQARKGSVRERYPSPSPSEKSYGHSGFTGTFVWADPVNQLLFVFLSNRVYPDRSNHKINQLGIRPMLLESFFKMANDPIPAH